MNARSLHLPVAFLTLLMPAMLHAAGERCSSIGTFSPFPGVTHQAVVLTDPAGQQTALFDLSWAGALVSLKYNGTEYLPASTTIAAAQPILRSNGYRAVTAGDDQNRGSVLLGVACGSNHVWTTSGMLDYDKNVVASTSFIHKNSSWNDFTMFAAPYTVSTFASFVPNPSGTPAYYLKLDQIITNIDAAEQVTFTYDFSAGVPGTLQYAATSPACAAGGCALTTPSMAAGAYDSASLSNGIAISTLPQTQWSTQSGVAAASVDLTATPRFLHLQKTEWVAPPQSAVHQTTYVMVGSWASASDYASRACTFSVSRVSSSTVANTGRAESLTVSAPAGCIWEGYGDNTIFLSVSPTRGTGPGTITYTVTPNPVSRIRTGNLFIAGNEIPIFQQQGCAYVLSPPAAGYGSTGGTGQITVTPLPHNPGNCTWTATTTDPFIAITGGASGGSTGGTVTYTVGGNSGAAHLGGLTVAGTTVDVGVADANGMFAFFASTPPVPSSNGTISFYGGAGGPSQVTGVTYVLGGATTGSGTATGTSAWTVGPLTLNRGVTTVTITATDSIGRTATATFDYLNGFSLPGAEKRPPKILGIRPRLQAP